VIREIATTGLYKRRGGRHALRGLDAAFCAGQITLLLGPNGAGKSTLLATLAHLLRPERGSVTYAGRPWAALDAAARASIAYLGHASYLYGDFTIRQNLERYRLLYRLAPAAIDQVLERLRLAPLASRPVRTLSRGQVQRAALARFFLPAPQVLLLDEPFTGLDEQARVLVEAHLVEERAAGRLIVLSSHHLGFAQLVPDQVLILQRGAGCHQGPVPADTALAELYRRALERGP